jgi:hypothetical protein
VYGGENFYYALVSVEKLVQTSGWQLQMKSLYRADAFFASVVLP